MNTITYMTGLLTFYLKGEISADRNFLRLKIPNTILALIPLGSKKDNVPVQQISTVAASFRMNFKSFILGIVELLIAFACFESSFGWGVALLILGAATIINSFVTELNVDTTAGVRYVIPFILFEKGKASQAEQLISNIISGRLNDTNVRQVAEAQTMAQNANAQAIINAIRDKR